MNTSINHTFVSLISRLLSSLASVVTIVFSHTGRLSVLLLSLLVFMPATTTFAAAPVAGFGTALDFDGVDDYVNIGHHSRLDLTNNLTIEAWIKTDSTSGVHRIFSKVASGGGYGFGINNNQLLFTTYSIKDYSTTLLDLTTGVWYHVAVVLDSNNDASFYLDGEFVQKIMGSSPARIISNYALIGSYNNVIQYWNGQIDDVRIWNVARTQTQIQANMYTPLQGNESGLVALYDFEDGTGTTATDRAGSNHGTLSNMNEDDWVEGIITTDNRTLTIGKNMSLNNTLSGYDADSNPLTYHIVNQGNKGTATITNANTGAFTYIPNTNIIGTDTFTYKVNDGIVDSNIATVTVNIINNAPIAGFGTALDFDGTNDYVNLGITLNFKQRRQFTFEAWIKPRSWDGTIKIYASF